MISEVSTIILRFRDLGIDPGETISRHREIIEKAGSVWWAWWRKGHEKGSADALGRLGRRAESQGLDIYLLDSGQKKIYKAKCSAIKYKTETTEDGIENIVDSLSPDKSKTPGYYQEINNPVWFQFLSIEDCDLERLYDYSYAYVENPCSDEDAGFQVFSGKRICSANELIQQNVSMWFVRKYRETDPDHEIVLMNANVTEPFDFSKKYYELRGDSLLWLSDLHCGGNKNVQVIKPVAAGEMTLAERIAYAQGKSGKLNDISSLIISGDITDCGKKAGFDEAEKLVEELGEQLKLKLVSELTMFCPGNHDFSRIEREFHGKSAEIITRNGDSTRYYGDFYRNIHNKTPNKFFACGRKYLTACGRTVEIAALNSVMLQQYKNFEGHGFLSYEQLDFVAEEMGWKQKKESSAVRIAVMHHHYLPTCYVEDVAPQKPGSVVYDAKRLMSWLDKYNIRILLHGHKHCPFEAAVEIPEYASDLSAEAADRSCDFGKSRKVYIIGMGSTCVSGSSGNMYGVIRFLTNSINIDFYRTFGDNLEEERLERTVKIPV